MPNVSVVVPVYNTEKYLVQCLDSLKSQTLDDIEFICINDGSTDNSQEILNKYAINDSRFKIIAKKNSGYGHTMNVGIENASGEYIGIVESDDFVEPDMYKTLYENAKLYNADLVKSNFWIYRYGEDIYLKALQNGPYLKVFTPRIEEQTVLLRGQSIWSAIYKKDMILRNNIRFLETPGASYQDTSFYFITMAVADRVVLLEDAFLHYRQDNPNSSVKSTGKTFLVCDEIKKIWDYLETKPKIKECLKYIVPEYQWNVYQWNITRLYEKDKFDFLERVYDEFKKLNDMNLLKREWWNNKKAFDKMRRITDETKEECLYDNCVDAQIERMYKNAFIHDIKSYSEIYLFGAGRVAKEVINLLKKCSVYPKSLVVSNPKDNPKEIMGYSVVGIGELKEETKANSLFLIAVTAKAQYAIIRQLQNNGVKNIIAVTDELRKI